jgi:hypothetical protein
MKLFKDIFSELFGLFVDDGSLAYALIGWLLVGIFILPKLELVAEAQAGIWVTGLLLLLVENIYRSAKRNRSGPKT